MVFVDGKGIGGFVSMILAGALTLTGPSALNAQLPGWLELGQYASANLPESDRWQGAAFTAAGGVVLWPDRGESLLLADGASVRRLSLDRPVSPVAVQVYRDDSVELVDGVSGSSLRFTGNGRLSGRAPLGLSQVELVTGIPVDDGWIVGGGEPDGAFAVYLASAGGPARLLYRLEAHTEKPVHAILSPAPEGALLTEVRWPFRNALVPLAGAASVFGPGPLLEDRNRLAWEAERGLWASAPTLALDEGYLQTLVDLTSDQRLLLLYDQAGRPARAVELEMPLAFFAADPGASRIFGVHSVDPPQAVTYRWWWDAANPESRSQ